MTISKLTGNIQPLDEVDKINEIIDGALENAGTGTNALAIMGTATGNRGVGIGQAAAGSGAYASGLGTGAKATGDYAIQIGYGTNSTASSLNIGFNASSSTNRTNWQLLDGTTGLIPDARLSSNIARTTDIASRNIGEIVTSTVPLTDAGLHLSDGSLIQGDGIYSAFVTAMAAIYGTNPELFCTEQEWQQSVTDYGVCGKFVYDSVNNTVRLPKVTGIIEGTTDVTALGDLVEAGLPNIVGSADVYIGGNTPLVFKNLTGAYSTSTSANTAGNNNDTNRTVADSSRSLPLDASKSNSIYGNSSTVQPQTIKVLYYIVIATTTKTDKEVDIDKIATDLNGKADVDLSNINNSGYSKAAKASMPSDTYVDLTLGASGSSYTAPADGWFYGSVISTGAGQECSWAGIIGISGSRSTGSGQYLYSVLPIAKGGNANFWYNGTKNIFRFIYAVGSESEAS